MGNNEQQRDCGVIVFRIGLNNEDLNSELLQNITDNDNENNEGTIGKCLLCVTMCQHISMLHPLMNES